MSHGERRCKYNDVCDRYPDGPCGRLEKNIVEKCKRFRVYSNGGDNGIIKFQRGLQRAYQPSVIERRQATEKELWLHFRKRR